MKSDESIAAQALDRFLSLAAAPSFAFMALFTALDSNVKLGAFCPTSPRESHLTGMVAMYVLMSLFHLKPWLRAFWAVSG